MGLEVGPEVGVEAARRTGEYIVIVGVSFEFVDAGVSVVFNGICVKICVSVELGDV